MSCHALLAMIYISQKQYRPGMKLGQLMEKQNSFFDRNNFRFKSMLKTI